MSSKRKMISAIVASVFAVTFGVTSSAIAAELSPAATQTSNNLIILAAANKSTDADGHDEHHNGHDDGHHGDMKSGEGHKDHGKCKMMSKADVDNDGKISLKEFMKHHRAKFDKTDANNDGFIDKDEMREMMKQMHGHGHKHNGDKKKCDMMK